MTQPDVESPDRTTTAPMGLLAVLRFPTEASGHHKSKPLDTDTIG